MGLPPGILAFFPLIPSSVLPPIRLIQVYSGPICPDAFLVTRFVRGAHRKLTACIPYLSSQDDVDRIAPHGIIHHRRHLQESWSSQD